MWPVCGHSSAGWVYPQSVQVVEVTEQATVAALRPLLADLAWTGDEAHVDRVMRPYVEDPDARLFAALTTGPIGVLGIRQAGDDAEVLAIVVAVPERRQGVGRALIEETQKLTDSRTMWAETDRDAVGFYQACGFRVMSLGEQHPGVERFRCTRLWGSTP